jgi:predicted membrane channel-forming protein YqfA (hemolysin III family)
MKAIYELFVAPNRDQTRREEIANSVSHGFGLAAAILFVPVGAACHLCAIFPCVAGRIRS